MILHSDRYAVTTTLRKNGVVVHTSEGGEGVMPWGQTASAQLVGFLKSPGDRPSPSRPGGYFGSGYHAVAGEDGNYVQVADASAGPFHAGGGINPCMWAVCIPGRASQTRTQWLGDVSRQYIRAVAKFIVDRWIEDGRSWPLKFVTGAELAKGQANVPGHPVGYTSHGQVTVSKLTSTDHSDPGPAFPWDVLAADIAALTAPPTPAPPTEDDDMPAPFVKCDNGDAAGFVPTGITIAWVDNEADLAVARANKTVAQSTDLWPVEDFKAYRLIGALPPGWAATDFRQVVG